MCFVRGKAVRHTERAADRVGGEVIMKVDWYPPVKVGVAGNVFLVARTSIQYSRQACKYSGISHMSHQRDRVVIRTPGWADLQLSNVTTTKHDSTRNALLAPPPFSSSFAPPLQQLCGHYATTCSYRCSGRRACSRGRDRRRPDETSLSFRALPRPRGRQESVAGDRGRGHPTPWIGLGGEKRGMKA